MAGAVEVRITNLLFAHVGKLEITPPLPIAYPGLAFTPPAGTYLEVLMLPNVNINRGLAATDSTQFRGILQVTVVAPGNSGIVAPTAIASEIVEHFERGTQIFDESLRIKIEGRPSIATAIQEPERIRVPVSIRWHAFA